MRPAFAGRGVGPRGRSGAGGARAPEEAAAPMKDGADGRLTAHRGCGAARPRAAGRSDDHWSLSSTEMWSSGMQMRQELVVQAEPDGDETSALVLHDGQRADLARLTDLIQQTRELVRHVSDAREGVMLVRRASATDKLVAE